MFLIFSFLIFFFHGSKIFWMILMFIFYYFYLCNLTTTYWVLFTESLTATILIFERLRWCIRFGAMTFFTGGQRYLVLRWVSFDNFIKIILMAYRWAMRSKFLWLHCMLIPVLKFFSNILFVKYLFIRTITANKPAIRLLFRF